MTRTYLALDLGGTKTEAGVVDDRGRVRSRVRVPTLELRSGGDPLRALIHLGRQALEAAGVAQAAGVGVALPGPVDVAGFRMLTAPTIPELEGRSLRDPLERAFGCRAAAENDANACALAEACFGAGRGARDLVYFTVSTGIGGGAVVDGKIFHGSRGTAVEVGHQIVIPSGGPRCDCGSSGCLEALASGRGILARARLAGVEAGDAGGLAELARRGDPEAIRIWEETVTYLGAGISNAINLLDPDVVVLGGGVSLGAADLLLEPLREFVAGRCMPSLGRPVSLQLAGLGADLGLVSAAVTVMPPADPETPQTEVPSGSYPTA